jgi:hypothetical protein
MSNKLLWGGYPVRFRIDAKPTGGLRVIEDIPDYKLCRLEGQNGIGKSLAVRLLQLVTGDQPWAGLDSAWATLRQNLRPARVVIEGLRLTSDGDADSTLTWLLQPEDWPERPQAEGPWTDGFLDNEPIGREAIRRLLKVFRIAGDESLAQSLAAQVQGDRLRLGRLSVRIQVRSERWDRRLRDLEALSGESSPRSLAEREAEVERLRSVVIELEAQLKRVSNDRKRLLDVKSLLAHRTELVERLPAVVEERTELASKQNGLISELELLDGKAATLRSQAERSHESAAQLAYLEDLHRKRRERLARRTREVRRLSSSIGLSDSVTSDEVATLERDTRFELSIAHRKRLTQDRAGILLDLADDLQEPLEQGVDSGFGDEIIAAPPESSLTVVELQTAIVRRRDELMDEVDSAGHELQDQIARLEVRHENLVALAGELRLLRGAQKDVADVAAQIEVLVGELSADAAQAYRTLVARRTSIADELVDIAARIGDLDRQRQEMEAGGNLEEVSRRLEGLKGAITPEAIDGNLQRTDSELVELTHELDQQRHRRNQAVASLEGQYANVSTGVAQLLHDDRFSWLRSASIAVPRVTIPRESMDIHAKASQLDSLRLAARRIRTEMTAASTDVLALDRAMEALAERLNRGQPAVEADIRKFRFTSEATRFYQARFTEQLAAEEIRDALFDGGSGLRLDLISMTTNWTTPAGERRTRPLEAFSSGERAFAYTRVQLEDIKSSNAVNRVAFLDEFGAYVARDRLDELLSYIRRRALRDLVDQVVVILPLASEMSEDETAEFNIRSYFARSMETEVGIAPEVV